jgi:hypothetical protein
MIRIRPERRRAAGRFVPTLTALEDRLVLSPPGSGWQLQWADEFNGTSLDTSRWTVFTGTRRDAVNTASAVSEGGGALTITTYTSGGTNYTGFIGTPVNFLGTYGYWEARINFQDSPCQWSMRSQKRAANRMRDLWCCVGGSAASRRPQNKL